MERVGVELAPERPRRPRLTAIVDNDVPADPAATVTTTDEQLRQVEERTQLLDNWARQLAMQEQALNQRAAALTRITQIHEASSRLLSTRAKLMLAVIGAFVLAMYAMAWQTNPGIWILIVWCVLAIGPLSFLEFTANRHSQL